MPTILAYLVIWFVLFVCFPIPVFVLTIIGIAIAVITWDSNRK